MIDEITANVAREGYESLGYNDGIVTFKDDAPAWVRNAVYNAHNDSLPNNWVFDVAREAFSDISDAEGQPEDEATIEFSDGADSYNADLLNWVRDYPAASGFIDEVKDEFGEPRDFYHGIQGGQYMARGMIFGIILEAVANEAGDREDDADEDDL